eukprot:CAMPEP_0195022250 /NCGR_PEP_ID=MMETSP0326_2-20130528/39964_1 /TAXON_ID=2866 ORGANISM="Crypthecodinium cohnii, Strain Seligo" /NCGR_SAMPLE_ID=MMETSP0326_2 /ASSEMBLY_ACC=CAM_ASM_000348 /LENGTH=69 /DNA_ID=CAMNT_0040041911 /DNA_START=342 /DNA_END=548 /DNA_ORIENTATION=+
MAFPPNSDANVATEACVKMPRRSPVPKTFRKAASRAFACPSGEAGKLGASSCDPLRIVELELLAGGLKG